MSYLAGKPMRAFYVRKEPKGHGTGQWMFFEKFIRRAAGMGTASREPDPDSYEIETVDTPFTAPRRLRFGPARRAQSSSKTPTMTAIRLLLTSDRLIA